jgi:signal peptidase II
MVLARRLLLVAALVATIGCDHVTKHVASVTLQGTPGRSFLSGTVRLVYAENEGGFLSLGADWSPGLRRLVFTTATGILLSWLILAAGRHGQSTAMTIGLALFGAGGASNWIDRLVHGRVVDFMNVGIGQVRTGVFNVADVAIMMGAAVVLVASMRGASRAARSS